MKKTALTAAVLVAVLSLSAAEQPVKFVPPRIVAAFEEERPQVKATGDFSVLNLPEDKKSSAGRKSTAGRLTEAGRDFQWRPSLQSGKAQRAADLVGSAVSPDGTAAIVLERIGGEAGPNSTRIVIFDLERCRIAGGFTIAEKLICNPVFIPGKELHILAEQRKCPIFKTAPAVVEINLESRKISRVFAMPEGRELQSFVWHRGQLMYALKGASQIYSLDLKDPGAEPAVFNSSLRSPRLLSCGKEMLIWDNSGVEAVVTGDDGNLLQRFAVPEGFDPTSGFMTGEDKVAVFFSSDGPLWYFRAPGFRKLQERTGGIAAYSQVGRQLFAVQQSGGRIACYKMPEAVKAPRDIAPNRIRPANRNLNYSIAVLPGKNLRLLQVDRRGNLFILYASGKRWRKDVVYIADRTGFR